MMFQCWPTVLDAGPTLKQHWVNASCLLAIATRNISNVKVTKWSLHLANVV